MRYSLLLLPMAVLGVSGCISVGAPAPQRIAATSTTPEQAGYMTQADSAGLIVLPGDTTTEVQLRFLSTNSPMTTADNARAGDRR